MNLDVDRGNFERTRLVDDEPLPLADGQVRLAVERFAVTANNISYALTGDMLDYWGFFPTDAPWGRIPVMGLGTVVESTAPDIATGGSYFGFFPMANELVVDARATGSGFVDAGDHRRGHASAYVAFNDVGSDPTFREDRSDEYLLLRGLFLTSFLIDDVLADNDFFEARQTLVTSASSKTSIALAHCLATRNRAPDTKGRRSIIGITSARNTDFVEGLGLYDEVILYDDIEELDGSAPSVMVDMAGDAEVVGRIHRHYGDALGHSCQVGATHWENVGNTSGLPGPEPTFFFAPTQLKKRSDEWGARELNRRIGTALGDFLDGAPAWLTVVRSAGPDAVAQVYADILHGEASAATGHILSMSPSAFAD